MNEISFVNVGYNVPEIKGLYFQCTLSQHAFFYFQGPAIVNGREVDSGACILYPGGTQHNYTTLNGFVNSYIGFYVPDELFSRLSIATNRILFPDNCEEINNILLEILQEDTERRRGYEEAINSLIQRLLIAIARGIEQKSERQYYADSLKKMTKLRRLYLSDIVNVPDINELISTSGFSRTQFYRLYSLFFHISPKEDLIKTRLESARELIRLYPDKKMYEVAIACGFNDVPNFFRFFKKRYNYTPKDYANAIKMDVK